MPALICSSCHLRCPVQRSSASWLAVRLKFLSHQFTHQNPNQVVLGENNTKSRKPIFNPWKELFLPLLWLNSHITSGCHHTETLYRESGARSQEPESSEQNSVENMTFRHSLRLLYCYCILIKNLELQIHWQLYSDHDYKWSHVSSNSEESLCLRVLGRTIFSSWMT